VRVLVILLMVAWFGGVQTALAGSDDAGEGTAVAVMGARVTSTDQRARLVLDLSGATPHEVFALDEPRRLVIRLGATAIDFDTADLPPSKGLVFTYNVGLLQSGEAGAVLFLGGPARVEEAYVLDAFGDQPTRLVVDLVRDSDAAFSAAVAASVVAMQQGQSAASGEKAANANPVEVPVAPAPPAAAPEVADLSVPGPVAGADNNGGVLTPEAFLAEAEKQSTTVASAAPTPGGADGTPGLAPSSRPSPPETLRAQELAAVEPQTRLEPQTPAVLSIPVAPASMARPFVVIDPGHGGVDGGATTDSHGLVEKAVTLQFALILQEKLRGLGNFDVALTRDDDRFVSLEDRVALARRNKADLLISVHADTFAEASVSGASIYTRDENATDVLDKVLADNENRADLLAGFPAPDGGPVVVDILVDLMRRDSRRRSYLIAQSVIAAMDPTIKMRRYPLRQADFFVLQAPDVPSVLFELGFLSNRQDSDNLNRPEWLGQLAETLAGGVQSYFAAREALTIRR
jgi:N-acetylmuramoyl-L-alanine amidase